jgi:TolB-like protein/Flp pilus assembly protein TadD
LAAIVFTDIVGFSALTEGDEVTALELLATQKRIVQPIVREFGGQWLKEMGDGLLLSFTSSHDAVRCAIRIQEAVRGIDNLLLRIGVHQGDVVQTETDVLGSGVNIASRVESVAPPGGVAISDKVQGDISHHADLAVQSIGFPKLKGIGIEFEVFCVTTGGLPVGRSHGKVEEPERLAKRKPLLLSIAAVVVLLAALAVFFLMPSGGVDLSAIPSKSIAVLPFDNFAKGEANENFANGLTEVITATLSKIGELKVISRTSVMAYKVDNRPTSPEIAAKLNVAHVLEGSVQRSGDQVRIVVQLIDAREDRHIWSETFDGSFSELFDVQTRVATNIASYLEANLTQQEQARIARKPTENMKAYEHYMVLLQRGIVHIDKRELDINLALAEKVVQLDPNFAEAHGIIALCHLGYYWSGIDHTDARLALAKAKVDIAIRLAPEAPAVHTAKGYLHYWGYGEFDKALVEFGIARKMEPSASQHIEDIAWVQRAKGDLTQAFASMDEALELNPQSHLILREMGFTHIVAKNWDRAIEILDRAILLNDTADYYGLKIDAIWARDGNLETALAFLKEAQGIVGRDKFLIHEHRFELDRGNYAASLKAIESIKEDPFLSQSRVIPKSLARAFVYARSGEPAKLKAALESSLEMLKRMANDNPIDPRVQMNMGTIYAMQGNEEQAIMRGRQALALYPLKKNAINAQRIHIHMGGIYLQLGQVDKCIELLESLKDKPLGMEVGELKTDSTWDPVRDHEAFKSIVRSPGSSPAGE